jgi:hypothetical protein
MKTNFILDYIKDNDGHTKEYELLNFIEEYHPDFFSPLGQRPSLFKQHFFLFNYLYKLNQQLQSQNAYLLISALEIRLCNINSESSEIGRTDALKAFYLNEENLKLSDEEITQMMQQFWEKYMALDKKADALKTLSLENEKELNKAVLKKRFNLLAKQHHPDKGGDKKSFIKIKQAYDELILLV